MDKYRRAPKQKADQSTIGENEIRILADWQRGARNYISYALNVLNAEVWSRHLESNPVSPPQGDKAQKTIVIRAMGNRAVEKRLTACGMWG